MQVPLKSGKNYQRSKRVADGDLLLFAIGVSVSGWECGETAVIGNTTLRSVVACSLTQYVDWLAET